MFNCHTLSTGCSLNKRNTNSSEISRVSMAISGTVTNDPHWYTWSSQLKDKCVLLQLDICQKPVGPVKVMLF